MYSFEFVGTFDKNFFGKGTVTTGSLGDVVTLDGTISTGPAASFASAPIMKLPGGHIDPAATPSVVDLVFQATQKGITAQYFHLFSSLGEYNSPFSGSLDFNVGGDPSGSTGVTIKIAAVPGPIAGAGLPALAAFAGFALWRRRREQALAG